VQFKAMTLGYSFGPACRASPRLLLLLWLILRLLNARAPPSRELVFRGDGNVSRRNPN
jgi:hypothetical protein